MRRHGTNPAMIAQRRKCPMLFELRRLLVHCNRLRQSDSDGRLRPGVFGCTSVASKGQKVTADDSSAEGKLVVAVGNDVLHHPEL